MSETNAMLHIPPVSPDVADKGPSDVPEVPAVVELANRLKQQETAGIVRVFDTGATRDQDTDKLDFDGFLSPLVIERYGEYMHKHRKQTDGSLRASDNWQKGIPLNAYMKSAWRHFRDWWYEHRGYQSHTDYKTHYGLEDALCALMFNTMGYLHEILKKRGYMERS